MEHQFKTHIESPFNPLTLRLRRETVLFRIKIMKEVFTKVENLHREEYETLIKKDKLEYETTQDEEGNYNDVLSIKSEN